MSEVFLIQKKIADKVDELLDLNSQISSLYETGRQDLFAFKLQCSFYIKRFEKIQSELTAFSTELDSAKSESASISRQLLIQQLLMISKTLDLLNDTKSDIDNFDMAKSQADRLEIINLMKNLKTALPSEIF